MQQIEARTVDDTGLSNPDCAPWLADILMGDVDLDILFRTSTDDLPDDPVGADVAQGSADPALAIALRLAWVALPGASQQPHSRGGTIRPRKRVRAGPACHRYSRPRSLFPHAGHSLTARATRMTR